VHTTATENNATRKKGAEMGNSFLEKETYLMNLKKKANSINMLFAYP